MLRFLFRKNHISSPFFAQFQWWSNYKIYLKMPFWNKPFIGGRSTIIICPRKKAGKTLTKKKKEICKLDLKMLNILHLTIADFYLRDFINFPPVSLRCRLLPPWPSCTSSSLFRTFNHFWPRVPAEEIFGQVGPPCTFYHHGMQYYISPRL